MLLNPKVRDKNAHCNLMYFFCPYDFDVRCRAAKIGFVGALIQVPVRGPICWQPRAGL